MRFEGRDLKPYAEPVSPATLKEDSVYFIVGFADDAMLIPEMDTVVYVGKNLEEGQEDRYYFQDVGSYHASGRLHPKSSQSAATYFTCGVDELKGVYEYESALEILMACSLRRNRQT